MASSSLSPKRFARSCRPCALPRTWSKYWFYNPCISHSAQDSRDGFTYPAITGECLFEIQEPELLQGIEKIRVALVPQCASKHGVHVLQITKVIDICIPQGIAVRQPFKDKAGIGRSNSGEVEFEQVVSSNGMLLRKKGRWVQFHPSKEGASFPFYLSIGPV